MHETRLETGAINERFHLNLLHKDRLLVCGDSGRERGRAGLAGTPRVRGAAGADAKQRNGHSKDHCRARGA